MKPLVYLLLGVLAILTGVVWTLQGLGVIEGSPMTGETVWAVIGPLLALVGVGLLLMCRRAARGHRTPDAS